MQFEVLYGTLKSYFRHFIDAEDTELGFLVLYATATHYFEDYQAFPILHINGDYATGKNRRIELVKQFCHKPVILTSPSLSSLFRIIDEQKGTILIDEADNLLRYSDLESVLLAGYKKGGQISRSSKDDTHRKDFRPTMFSVYCPKVLVTRGGLMSDALKSRSITIITFPKSKDSNVPDIMSDADLATGGELREMLDTMIARVEQLESHDIELNLYGRNAEIFDCIQDVSGLYGEEAITDLQDFIENTYLPETEYTTMLSLNEDLILALNELWDTDEKLYLTKIRKFLEGRSIDYRSMGEKEIGPALRSLKFKLKRASKGYYVLRNTQNTQILELWSERYLHKRDELDCSDTVELFPRPKMVIREDITESSGVIDVANVGGVQVTRREEPQVTKLME